MILISHRGNTRGQDALENHPKFIDKALSEGFHVEVDVWKTPSGLYLGHDNPKYLIDLEYLLNDKFWCHAKNFDALNVMIENKIRCFWHQEDDYTITSNGYVWTYPLKQVCKNSIIVCKNLKDTKKYLQKNIYGVCSDHVGELK